MQIRVAGCPLLEVNYGTGQDLGLEVGLTKVQFAPSNYLK